MKNGRLRIRVAKDDEKVVDLHRGMYCVPPSHERRGQEEQCRNEILFFVFTVNRLETDCRYQLTAFAAP